jgi:hypothetical protein
MDIFFGIMFIVSHSSMSFQAFAIGTYGVSYYDVILGFFYLVCLKRIVWDGIPFKFTKSTLYLFYILMFTGILLGGINILKTGTSNLISQYLKSAIHILFYFLFPIFASSLNFKKNLWIYFIKTFIILSIIVNIFGVYQIVARAYNLPLAELPINNMSLLSRTNIQSMDNVKQLSLGFSGFYRATSFFSEPSSLAGFDVTVLIFLIVPFFQKAKPFIKSKAINIIAFITTIIGLFLTFTIQGIFLTLGLILGLIFFEKTKRVLYIIPIIFISTILILLADFFVQSYSEQSVLKLFNQRILGILYWGRGKKPATVGESYGYRMTHLQEAYKLWTYYPLLGSGIGSTASRSKEVGIGIGYAMMTIMAILSEDGLLGALGFIGMFFIFGYYSIRFLYYLRLKYKIPDDLLRFFGLIPYMTIYLFLSNFFFGNCIAGSGLWHLVGFLFYIIFEMNGIEGKDIYIFDILKTPFKKTFSKRIEQFLINSNS